MTEKLAKYLARCGVASRRACEEYIRAGLVQVDGQMVSTPETRIDPAAVKVLMRGCLVQTPRNFRYILFNKPVGVICTCRRGREQGQTILDWVKVPERVFPAGRLDRDSSGLMLLTNDGGLVQRLTHPSFEQEREYQVTLSRPLEKEELAQFREGIHLSDGLSRFRQISLMGERRLRIIMGEGRKRQIRRTLEALGLTITELHRVRFGSLRLQRLPRGVWRDLSPNEISKLIA